MFNKIIAIVILLIFGLSVINAADEAIGVVYEASGFVYVVVDVVVVSFLAVLAPIISMAIAVLMRKVVRRPKVPEIGAYIVGAVGLVAYTYYVANGQTDPNTAAHMHVVLFPVLYVLFSLVVMALSVGVSFIGGRRSANQ